MIKRRAVFLVPTRSPSLSIFSSCFYRPRVLKANGVAWGYSSSRPLMRLSLSGSLPIPDFPYIHVLDALVLRANALA